MKVAVANDHGGFALKDDVKKVLEELGCEVLDLGAHEYDADDDYPDFARYAGQAIQHGQAERAIVLCGSGVGASVAANKLTGVRASVCHDVYSAGQGVEHDDMNVLCLGARIVGPALIDKLVKAFVEARFDDSGRFRRRLDKVNAMEAAG
ncbi:MAG: RpiB/LacA/LacB family sugar-phosphate isomerase [Planctomycetota bacterium]